RRTLGGARRAHVIEALRDAILAPRCAGCGDPGRWYCVSCRDQAEARSVRGPVAIRAVGEHEGSLRSAIHRLKYGGDRALAADLRALVAEELAPAIARGAPTAVLPPR